MSATKAQPVWTCPGCLQSYWIEAPFTGPWKQYLKCWGCGAVYMSDRPDGRGRKPKVHQQPKARSKPKVGEMGKSARRLLAVARRDRWICWLCGERVDPRASGKRRATRDHVIPRSKGGPDALSNLRLAHYSCNSRRGDKPVPVANAGEGEQS